MKFLTTMKQFPKKSRGNYLRDVIAHFPGMENPSLRSEQSHRYNDYGLYYFIFGQNHFMSCLNENSHYNPEINTRMNMFMCVLM